MPGGGEEGYIDERPTPRGRCSFVIHNLSFGVVPIRLSLNSCAIRIPSWNSGSWRYYHSFILIFTHSLNFTHQATHKPPSKHTTHLLFYSLT